VEEAKFSQRILTSTSRRKLGREYRNGCVSMGLILSRIRQAKKVFTWFLMVTSPIPWA
jgi:hypothetical protein